MFVYETQPHPTQKNKVLAIIVKRSGYRANTIEEDAFEMIGGKHWRPVRGAVRPSDTFRKAALMPLQHERFAPDFVGYTLSKAQARDLDIILAAGFRPTNSTGSWNWVDAEDRLFFHPDIGQEDYTRKEALEMINLPNRCSRTNEMDFAG